MADTARSLQHNFTWDDYQSWPDEERWEVIGGEAFAMSPSPGSRHQSVVGRLYVKLERHFDGKQCRPFIAPLDVKLSETDVVQPDLLVVCDPKQIKRTHIEGAPSLVVEILSPFTESHDRGRKLDLYARSGVGEYWIVSAFPSYVEVLALDDSSYRICRVFQREEALRGKLFPDLEIQLREIFDFPLDDEERDILRLRDQRRPYGGMAQ